MAETITQGVPALRIEGLRMVYHPGLFQRRKLALHGLDLEVPKGSIYGFLGQNGAGKTTTLKTLVGLQMPTAGRAWIFGTDIRESASRAKVGFMPENPYFYEYLTARETLDFYGRLAGMPRAERRRRGEYLLERFGLGHAKDGSMRDFSKGMRQRLGLAQAILNQPPLVLLDEPMSGLDPLGRRDIRNEILALRDAGCTVFFSSHILSDVADICDRVCILHEGRKVAEGRLPKLLGQRVLEVQMSASGVPKEGLHEAAKLARRAWHDGELYHLLLESEDLALKAKEAIERGGGTLRRLVPHHESLEEYFIRVTREGDVARLAGAEEGSAAPEAASAPGPRGGLGA
ncbi:MAG: ABC transporter ATP-binding protein [Planctomycetota bacterium]|nr:ABC transporter ATP-binding protein [Planctomycetota bacterium]